MLNHIIVMGRLTKNPELRNLPTGSPVTSFSIAVDRDYKDKMTGQVPTDFFEVVVYGPRAETVSRYFEKGSMAVVEGRLQIDVVEKNGQRNWYTKINASQVHFGESKREADARRASGGGGSYGGNSGGQNSYGGNSGGNNSYGGNSGGQSSYSGNSGGQSSYSGNSGGNYNNNSGGSNYDSGSNFSGNSGGNYSNSAGNDYGGGGNDGAPYAGGGGNDFNGSSYSADNGGTNGNGGSGGGYSANENTEQFSTLSKEDEAHLPF